MFYAMYYTLKDTIIICDVVKQYELELANTVFKIQPNKTDSFFCFLIIIIIIIMWIYMAHKSTLDKALKAHYKQKLKLQHSLQN